MRHVDFFSCSSHRANDEVVVIDDEDIVDDDDVPISILDYEKAHDDAG